MLWIALFLSVVFGSIGFIVNRDNARYILSGYNTMSEADRRAIDMEAYLRFFRRFHVFLGLSLLVGTGLLSLIDANWASMFMTIYPLAAYLFFIVKGGSYFPGKSQKMASYVVVGVLFVVIGLVVVFSLMDYRSSNLRLQGNQLQIDGSFGMTLRKGEVYGQELTPELPAIAYKSKGFAAGDYAKGRFMTKDGRTVYLFVNKKVTPFLRLKTAKGTIYYNHDSLSMAALSQQITQWRNGAEAAK